MKKWHKVLVISLIIIFIIVFISFVNSIMNHFLFKPFSETCGYSGTSDKKVECDCDGFTYKNNKIGSTDHYCIGECSNCKCYQLDWSKQEEGYKPVDCATFSSISWSFPINKTLP